MSVSQPAALLLKAPRELAFEPLELVPPRATSAMKKPARSSRSAAL